MIQSEANDTLTSNILSFYDGLTALFTCNVLVGLPANLHVAWLIAGGAGGGVASELFALNLAVSEIVFCVFSLYMMLHCLLRMALDVGLLVLHFMLQLMLICRPVFQSCICLERYLAVVHPTVFLRFRPLRYRLACCAVDWLLVLLDCTIPVFTLSHQHSVYLLISESLFFLVLMLSCGVHVLCVLRRPAPGAGGRDHESRGDVKRKASKVILITLVFTGTTQLLQAVVLGPILLYGSMPVILWGILFSLAVDVGGGFVTPLLYLHRTGKLPFIKF